MAWTEFGTNDAQTRKVWGKLTMYDVIQETFFSRFMGTDEYSIIQRITDLEREAGDEVRYDLLYNMKSFGVDGDDRLQGFEEGLRYAQDQVRIDQKRLGHRFSRMTQQRTIHNLRADGRRMIAQRKAQIFDLFISAYLAGTAGLNTDLAAALPFAGNALQAPDADHLITAGANFTTDVIDQAVERAKTFEENGIPNMRPCRMNGEEKYVMLLHPFAVKNLRIAAGANLWREIVSHAGVRGDQNPLYTGALGEWNGVVLHEWTRIMRSTGPLVHNLFLGAQAGVLAMGNAYDKLDQRRVGKTNMISWFEDDGEDYGNQKGIAAGCIYGIKKCRFTDPDVPATPRDFGVIRVDTTDAATP